jgi:hypothetical protein
MVLIFYAGMVEVGHAREIGERVGGGGRYWGMAAFMVLQMAGSLLLPLFPAIAPWFPQWPYGP